MNTLSFLTLTISWHDAKKLTTSSPRLKITQILFHTRWTKISFKQTKHTASPSVAQLIIIIIIISDIFSTAGSAPPDILLSRCWASVCVALHPALQIRDKEQPRPVPPVHADKHWGPMVCWQITVHTRLQQQIRLHILTGLLCETDESNDETEWRKK